MKQYIIFWCTRKSRQNIEVFFEFTKSPLAMFHQNVLPAHVSVLLLKGSITGYHSQAWDRRVIYIIHYWSENKEMLHFLHGRLQMPAVIILTFRVWGVTRLWLVNDCLANPQHCWHDMWFMGYLWLTGMRLSPWSLQTGQHTVLILYSFIM